MFEKRQAKGDDAKPALSGIDAMAEREQGDRRATERGERGLSAAPASGRPQPPRRPASLTTPAGLRPGLGLPGQAAADNSRKLVVGREISLAGEIKACEKLVVEGRVEADLKDCRMLHIAQSGLYRGGALVQQAEIGGRFEGDLTVTGLLKLQPTGRITGTLRYGEIEIARGGKIAGTVEEIEAGAETAAEAAPETAAERA